MVEVSGPSQAERVAELRTYAEKGASVRRSTCGWAAGRIEDLQEFVGILLGDRDEALSQVELLGGVLARAQRPGSVLAKQRGSGEWMWLWDDNGRIGTEVVDPQLVPLLEHP